MEKIQPQGATEDAVAKETKRKGCREAGRREACDETLNWFKGTADAYPKSPAQSHRMNSEKFLICSGVGHRATVS